MGERSDVTPVEQVERLLRGLGVWCIELHTDELGTRVDVRARNADMSESVLSRDSLAEALEALHAWRVERGVIDA